MSASSQLINSMSKNNMRHLNAAIIETNKLSSTKMRLQSDSDMQQLVMSGTGGARSQEGSPVHQGSATPKLLMMQRTVNNAGSTEEAVLSKSSSSAGTTKSNNSSKRSSPCLKTLRDEPNKLGASANKGAIVSLFAKISQSEAPQIATNQMQQVRQSSQNPQHEINAKQIPNTIKHEDNTSTTTTTSETSEIQPSMLGPSLNNLLSDKHNNLFQAADKIRGFVRNQALFQQMTSQIGSGINSSGTASNMMGASVYQTSQLFNHHSKFYLLETQPIPQSVLQQQPHSNSRTSQKKNGRRFGVSNSPPSNETQQRIPDISEWFQSLSIDDRVLCLTIIDDFFADSVIRMQGKINKNGQGLFKFQQRVVKDTISNSNLSQAEQLNQMLKQDYAFQSMKAILKKNKDQFTLQTKQIPEKEFLDYVRITYTEFSENPKSAPGRYQACQKMNTITVSSQLVQNPQKLIELLTSIVGTEFLKNPYDVNYDEHTGNFNTKSPVWFQANEHNSLAYWIIFYLEISLWVHYLSYVKAHFRVDQSINKQLFIKKEFQYINIKSEIKTQWFSLLSDSALKQIGNEVFARSLKQNNSKGEISQLNGGLINESLYSENRIIEVLLCHQEPSKFLQELCMIQLARIDDLSHSFLLNQILLDVLRERLSKNSLATAMVLATQMSTGGNSNLKNKKKKDKKKIKKLRKLEIGSTTQDENGANAENDDSSSDIIQEEIKEEEPAKVVVLDQSDTDEEQGCSSNEDFCSNHELIHMTTNNVYKSERNKGAIDEILSELLIFEDQRVEQNFTKAEAIQEQIIAAQNDLNQQQTPINSQQVLNTQFAIQIVDFEKHENHQAEAFKKSTSSAKRAAKLKKKTQVPEITTVLQSEDQRDPSPVIQPFQIIRSQKPMAESPVQTQAKKNLNKKKKRSKAVEPQSSSQLSSSAMQTSHKTKTGDLTASSSALDKFMRSIIKSDEEKDDVQVGLSKQQDTTDHRISNNKFRDAPSKNVNSRGIRMEPEEDKRQARNNNYANQANNVTKSVYVKKGTQPQATIEEIKKDFNEVLNLNQAPQLMNEETKQLYVPHLNKFYSTPQMPLRQERFENIELFPQQQMYQEQRIEQPGKIMKNRLQKSIDQYSSQGAQLIESRASNKDKNNKKKSGGNAQTFNGNAAKKRTQGSSSKYTATNKKSNNLNCNPIVDIIPQRPLTPVDLQQYGSLANQQMLQYPYLNMGGVSNMMSDAFGGIANMQQFQIIIEQLSQQVLMQQQVLHNQHNVEQDPYQEQFINGEKEDSSEIDHISESYYKILDQQIQQMVKEIERKLESVHKERQSVIEDLRNIVKGSYQKGYNALSVNTRIYGSMASGLAIEQSDVDLAVVGLDFQGSKELQINEMRRLCDDLQIIMKNSLHSLNFIDTASVPVIKLQVDLQQVSKNINKRSPYSQTGGQQVSQIDENMRFLGIDITFEDSSAKINHVFQCINYIQELQIAQPCLKPIVLILKKILQKQNLNQPYLGGLNSYSLVLMTSAFLNRLGCGEQMSKNLQEILNFYGFYFNPSDTTIVNQDFISGHQLIDPMTVIDPHNPSNNVTRSAFKIKEIQMIFKIAFQFLTDNKNTFKLNYDSYAGGNAFEDIITKLIQWRHYDYHIALKEDEQPLRPRISF